MIEYFSSYIITDSVGGGVDGDTEGMVIYFGEGDGLTGMYGQPYFDNTMKTNYTVQVCCWVFREEHLFVCLCLDELGTILKCKPQATSVNSKDRCITHFSS